MNGSSGVLLKQITVERRKALERAVHAGSRATTRCAINASAALFIVRRDLV
jgi:hypothetical protein